MPPLQDSTPDLLGELKKHVDALRKTPLQQEMDRVILNKAETKRKWAFVPWAVENHVFDDTVHFAEYRLNQGDTLVFIDTPIAHQSSPPQFNCLGFRPASQVLHVHSEKLFALTNSKFPKMLQNETYQSRIKRRRQPPPPMMEGIKYLLDLTPSDEGEDVAYHLSELSLSPGIIKWPTTAKLMGVDGSSNLSNGHDDICSCNTPPLPKNKNTETENSMSEDQRDGPDEKDEKDNKDEKQDCVGPKVPQVATESLNVPLMLQLRGPHNQRLFDLVPHLKIPDYCQVRHAHAIIRLLSMIEGQNVPINSAAMAWTMTGISKIFECPQVVRDQVTSWIMADTRFVEALPEEALRIAFALELPQITRFAFRILVNEAALEKAGESTSTKVTESLTVFNRQKGNLDDELRNLIQHAASALLDRLAQSLDWLTNEQNITSSSPPELEKVTRIEPVLRRYLKPGRRDDFAGDALSQIDQLKTLLQRKVDVAMKLPKGFNFWNILDSTYEEMNMWRATFADVDAFKGVKNVLAGLTQNQRLICPFTYHFLQDRFSNGLGSTVRSNQLDEPMLDEPTLVEPSVDRLIRWLQVSLQLLAKETPEFALDPVVEPLFEGFTNFGTRRLRLPLLDEWNLYDELHERVKTWAWLETRGPQGGEITPLITCYMNLTLTNNEMKYLPLWAGGRNDGTGGVFENELPPAEMGPNGPGPAYHTGVSIAQSISESLTDDVGRLEIRGSTVVGSVDVQDGASTVYAPNHVIAAGSSIASESFVDDDDEFHNARFEMPGDGQASGEAIEMIVGSMDTTMSDAPDDHDFDWLSESDASDDTMMFGLKDKQG